MKFALFTHVPWPEGMDSTQPNRTATKQFPPSPFRRPGKTSTNCSTGRW